MRIIHRTAMQTFSSIFRKLIVIEELPGVSMGQEWMEPKNVLN
jgi:hypothetical protein